MKQGLLEQIHGITAHHDKHTASQKVEELKHKESFERRLHNIGKLLIENCEESPELEHAIDALMDLEGKGKKAFEVS